MRILFTITGPWGTGAATVVDGVVKTLQDFGHTVRVVFPDLGLPSPDADKYYGNPDLYHIIRFPLQFQEIEFPTFPLIVPDPNPRNLKKAWTFKEMPQKEFQGYIAFLKFHLQQVIQDFRPDIIETEHVWLMGYVLSELGYAYIVGAHNSDQMGFRYDPRMRPYARTCARNAAYIFSISAAVRKDCLELYGVEKGKVVVIPNGYDTKIFRPVAMSKADIFEELGIDADPSLPAITFGGKMSKTKGVDVLLAANRILQKRHPSTLLLFGSGSLEDVLGRPPFGEEVRNAHLIGHVPQDLLAKFHNIAEFSVLPSREEGFAVAALEAMGCGLPVVATDIPSLRDLVVGKVVPVEDPVALAEAMESFLILSADEKKAIADRCLEKAGTYSWKKNTDTRLEYYRAAISHVSFR
jgi:glycosyltransferase involved in cell wall biosynthesis